MRLRGKTAFITGAGSGVGQAVAELFAQEGADLALLDINADGLKETARRVVSTERRCLLLNADLSDVSQSRTAVDVAHLALYLASEEASYANGEIFILDGGNLAVGR